MVEQVVEQLLPIRHWSIYILHDLPLLADPSDQAQGVQAQDQKNLRRSWDRLDPRGSAADSVSCSALLT